MPTWKRRPGCQLHTIGDQVPSYVPGVPDVVEQERGPTRDPPQPASIDMGLNVGNEVSLMHVADDTGDAPHRPKVHMTDVIVWRLSWQCLVVQIFCARITVVRCALRHRVGHLT